MFALVDCNNFYASCERVFRPELTGKPIVVLSNNDGCVIARSDEAKQLGIPMGAPAFDYQEVFSANKVVVFSSNYALYGDMSNRVMSILRETAPETEVYSVDEAFMYFGNSSGLDLKAIGKTLVAKIKQYTGIPVSIGFAETKALAKLANRIAKKHAAKTENVYCIDSNEKRIKALKWLKIEDVWGIGSAQAALLKKTGITNAFEFTERNDVWVKKEMSIVGLRLKRELLGKQSLFIEKEKARKNIACTRSFDTQYHRFEDINERVATYAFVCAEKLRQQDSNCNALMVFIHTNEHRKDHIQYSQNTIVKLPFPSNSGIELARFAEFGLNAIFRKGYLYKKAGVIAMEITPCSGEQTKLFENRNKRHSSLMKAVDAINQQEGRHSVRLAVQSPGLRWKMRQEHMSGRYTTRLNEIITIRS